MRNKALVVIGVLVVGTAPAQQQEKMTARDMFYSAAGLVAPPKPAATPKPGPAAGPKRKAMPAPAPGPVLEADKKSPAPRPGTPSPGSRPGPAPGPAEAGPQVVLASAAPLGLRYSILKQAGGGGAVEVDADTVFRSGDRIRLTVTANDRAHLYLVQQGSSGNWSVLFPSPEIAGGNNVIEKDKVYEIPAGHWFAFDEQAGKEKLFLVLSRRPEPNLEKMIYSLKQGAEGKTTEEKPKMLLAQDRPINDALVERVRAQVYARDLVFEKVDEGTPGEKKEKAVYVVNKTGAAESRVVADVTLNHQ